MAKISIYTGSIKNTTGGQDMELTQFVDFIRTGVWRTEIEAARALLSKTVVKAERSEIKSKLSYVTISGTFPVKRHNEGLFKHSGYLAIDIDPKDNENVLDMIDELNADRYTSHGFVTASGTGYCLIVRIEPGKHDEAFHSLQQYYFNNYKIIIDRACKDVSRPRYVSYDPKAFSADEENRFTAYVKRDAPKKIDQAIFVHDDFTELLQDIQAKHIDLVDGYYDWMRCGMSFVHKFGEAGRVHFHTLSQQGCKYIAKDVDRQYNACMRHKGDREATISTFYYLAKTAGLKIYSDRTKTIVAVAAQARENRLTEAQAAKALAQYEGITGAEDAIAQVYLTNIMSVGDESIIQQVALYLKHNHKLRLNSITNYVEDDGKQLESREYNDLFLALNQLYPKLTFELFNRVIDSSYTPKYNPFEEWFENNSFQGYGFVDAMIDTVVTPDKEYFKYFHKKWLVGMIATMLGYKYNELFNNFIGKQGCGKTWYMRHFYPEGLKRYVADSKLDRDKDDDILMCQKFFILDDECSGKSKGDERKMKDILSKDEFTVRPPYGRFNLTMKRIASLAGNSNEDTPVTDTTGNRRILVFRFLEYNQAAFNAIDKNAVFAELKQLVLDEFDYQVNGEDVKLLTSKTSCFEKFTVEYELFTKHFRVPADGEESGFYSGTEIMDIIQVRSQQKLTLDKICKELRRESLGIRYDIKKIDGATKRGYFVIDKQYSPASPFASSIQDVRSKLDAILPSTPLEIPYLPPKVTPRQRLLHRVTPKLHRNNGAV